MTWLEFSLWMVAAAGVGFWAAWSLRGEVLARQTRELKYLKSLWARMADGREGGAAETVASLPAAVGPEAARGTQAVNQ